MTWYRDGVITLTNGSKAVTGTGTAWLDNVTASSGLKTPTGIEEIESVSANGALQLAVPYTGPTVSNVSYAIIPTQGLVPTLAKAVIQMTASTGQVRDAYVGGNIPSTLDLNKKAGLLELADSTGSALLGYDGMSVQDILDYARPLQNYTALLAYKGRAKAVRITTPGIAGVFQYNASGPNTSDGGCRFAHGSGTGCWDRLTDAVHIRHYGAVCDGVADDTAALVAADAGTIALKRPLVIEGTPLIKQALTFAGKSNWRFAGPSGALISERPSTYLIKHASVQGNFLTFTGSAISLEYPAILGQAGNAGDGIVLRGHSPQLLQPFVVGMGQDGIRIGADTGPSNVNCFFIANPRCMSNGRDGININDKPAGAPDANAGSLVNPVCNNNARHGLYWGNSYLGTTVICPTTQANAGSGIYLDTKCAMNVILGGDSEANQTSNLFEAVPRQNMIIGLSVQGKMIDTRGQGFTWIPVAYGGSAAGACTYQAQQGTWTVDGLTAHVTAYIKWTGHTGTGQLYMTIPTSPYATSPNLILAPVEKVIPASIAIPAGSTIEALVQRDGNRLQFYTVKDGALSPLTITGSGELYLRFSYPIQVPNFCYLT